MKILYLNILGVIEGTGRAMRACGHNLVLGSGCVEALETLRNPTIDAVVITTTRKSFISLLKRTRATRHGRSLLHIRGAMAF
jgi:hypothetical protein